MCLYLFFLSMHSRTPLNPHGARSTTKCTRIFFFFPLRHNKMQFYLFNVNQRMPGLSGNCLQSISSPVISFRDYQPQLLNRPAVLCGIKVNIESLGKIWKCSWSLKAMGKLIKFQHEILTQFNLMLSGLIVKMSSDYKLVSISLKYMWYCRIICIIGH